MKQFLLLLGILSLLSLGSADTIAFNCNSNQVGGAKCKNWGTTFTWDRPSNRTSEQRTRGAGCGRPNRCSRPPYGSGYQCDEYPFKSVRESDRGNQVNRCVAARQNNAQGQALRNFYYSRGEFRNRGCHNQPPCRLSVAFSNASRLGYCQSRPNCRNDGNEYTRSGPARRDEVQESEFFRLASGTVLFAPGGARIGDVVYHVSFRNETLLEERDVVDGENDDDDDAVVENMQVDEDPIVAVVEGWMDENEGF
ncbi:hypothetical protein BO70DRAFT_418166 [Aspergillus heteromorphus CBS 117.55]|uniref:Deoxyribonuclease NucA/NucB domain-containing protein n=1 Tax=Aspergillus heteromorphus CBS 117.55 TaxID=1448321 RepID=A0A317WV97_9EURO|nr:uncharacterized protein BO70DRAFT_418166 [Aspergillus heteromorphus CBS 117.55]PWY89147.1 hypothetical protein BO70DRAFT_418166 [Aspergillus heteromorphus CBS 117.55]